MEETLMKRQREEEKEDEVELTKRQKSYKDLLSILDEDEDESTHDLSSLITTLQQEISSSFSSSFSDESSRSSINDQTHLSNSSYEEEDETNKVIRHLLEASDDELGIPTTAEATAAGDFAGEIDDGDWLSPVSAGDGLLWEIEDEAANYYTLLQSELFL